jgi:predicted metalloprotease with PDZ domain
MLHPSRWLQAVWCLAGLAQTALAAATPTITLDVDASDAPRGIERAHLVMPVKPGALTLLYPKWLPGEHSADGPVGSLSGLKFVANGQTLQWHRDPENMFAFHLEIPPGASSLDVALEVLSVHDAALPNAARMSTESLAIILWNQVLLYPAAVRSDDLQVAARLKLPAGWTLATALPRAGTAADAVQFRSVSLTTLIDSPVLAGVHTRTLELGGSPPTFLHLAADSDAATPDLLTTINTPRTQ